MNDDYSQVALGMPAILMIFSLIGVLLAPGGLAASTVELPIDSDVKASVVAATKHFHPQSCVSDEFKTVLNEYESYWSVTLTNGGLAESEECKFKTVYVCKSDASIAYDDPDIACAT